jgi:Ca2+-binding RTX toxin-like protein
MVLAMLVAGVGAPGAWAATERVSVSSSGAQANDRSGESFDIAVSADGRYVAFKSRASNLVPGDTNGAADLFVRDRFTGATELVSIDSAGNQIEVAASGGGLSMTPDGRLVAFTSIDNRLLLRDRVSATTEPAATSDAGVPVVGSIPLITPDGRYVAFSSYSPSVVAGDSNGVTDAFVYDRLRREIERVSVSSSGSQGNATSYAGAISADGRYVALGSHASNLVPGDTNDAEDVFVYDREADTATRVSVDSQGAQVGQRWTDSRDASMSADGRFVAFASDASTLVAGDTNNATDIFVHDRQSRVTERVSVTSAETQANRGGHWPAISADGRYVYFHSWATNISSSGGFSGVFQRDRTAGVTRLMSRNSDGVAANGHSSVGNGHAITADGRTVAFSSEATNLVDADTNATRDVFITGTTLVPRPVCEGEPATIVGTSAAEALTGTASRDVIVGLGGADTIEAGLGDDIVCGDGGPTATAQEGADVLNGESGDDVLAGGGAADRLWGTSGTDRLLGGWGKDTLGAGGEDDTLAGGSGDDTLDGGTGTDVIEGGAGRDVGDYASRMMPVTATIGDGPGDGELGEGDDIRGDVEQLRGGHAGDRLVGDDAANSLYGGDGDDELTGRGGPDTLFGDAGADRIDSRDDVRDSVYCGSDLDTVLFDPLDSLSAGCETRTPS